MDFKIWSIHLTDDRIREKNCTISEPFKKRLSLAHIRYHDELPTQGDLLRMT